MMSAADLNRLKKRLQMEFRRYITWKSTGKNLRAHLGAEIVEIREWIESNWLPEMTWDNYGQLWVIDHVVPLRMFDLNKEEDMAVCWHYKNLMPLLKEDNHKKEGNVFMAFELLYSLKDKDFFFQKLYERILPEVKWMAKYIDIYQRRYGKPANIHPMARKKLTA